MKNFRWFRSRSFESPLSINPDLVTNAADSIRSAHNSKQDSSSISFNAVVLGATGISLLGLAVVACSKQAHQPVTSLPTNVSPAVLQQPAASMPSAAAPATSVAEAKPMLKKAVHKRPEKVIYKNDTYGIAFQYPRRYALKTGDEAIIDWFGSQPVGTNFVDEGGVAVAAVELPRGLYPGTDYRDAFFTISVNRNLSEAQCSQFAQVDSNDNDEEPVAPSNVNFGGRVYSQTSLFDGKAFEQGYGRYYHVYNDNACYEMALGLETAGYGAVDGVTPVDRDEVFHKLEGMLASVRLRAEEKLPAIDVASSSSNTVARGAENTSASRAESEGSH